MFRLIHVTGNRRVLLWPGAGALTELLSSTIARGNGDTEDEGLFLQPLYFASLDIASPKIIPTPLSQDELLKNTTGETTFKL